MLKLDSPQYFSLRRFFTPWRFFVVALLLALSFAVIAAYELIRERSAVRRLTLEIIRSERDAAVVTGQTSDKGSEAIHDFSTRLPRAPQVRDLLAEIQRSTSVNGVSFGGIQRQDQNSGTEQLGRSDLAVTLKGSYVAVKAVVSNVLDRFPNVTVAQWRMRRAAQPSDSEATLLLAVWSVPGGTDVGR